MINAGTGKHIKMLVDVCNNAVVHFQLFVMKPIHIMIIIDLRERVAVAPLENTEAE